MGKNTIDDKIIIGSSILKDLYTCIDAEYVVNPEMINHTGVSMTFVTELIHIKLSK